jgi:hypothetical protein
MLLVHLLAPTTKASCIRSAARPACNQVSVNGNLYPALYFAHILVAEANATAGVSGASFGIEYGAPIQIYDWVLCADSEMQGSGWPASGSGNQVAWNSGNCQRFEPGGAGTGVVANAGYFYMAAYDVSRLSVTPVPGDSRAFVTSCEGIVDEIAVVDSCNYNPFGSAGFGEPGFQPCPGLRSCPCQISGPPILDPGAQGTYSTAQSAFSIPAWSIDGNGTILGPANAWSIQVEAGGSGTFTLSLNLTNPGIPHFPGTECEKTVTVDSGVPAVPSTWGGIKSLYR